MANKFECTKAEEEHEDKAPVKVELLGPLEIPPNEHKTQYVWHLWHSKKSTIRNFDQNLRQICRWGSVEGFWRHYQWLKRPSALPTLSDYHLFREGIKPMWEHPCNVDGGAWKVWLRKGVVDRLWENLLLAVVGESLDLGEEVCGVVVAVKAQEDSISVWNRSGGDARAVEAVRRRVAEALQLPQAAQALMEYRLHAASLSAARYPREAYS